MAKVQMARSKCRACSGEIAESNRKFCSNRCQAELRYRLYIEDWKAGVESGIQAPYGVSNHVRRYLLEAFGEKCQQCGWAERHSENGRVPLNVHHVDGSWENCDEDNLLLLCPNCHALTASFGARNRGKGRAARYVKTPL